MSIRLFTLGAPNCRVGDVVLSDLPAQKARFALLIYLAIERNVAREEVSALFWPESDDERARHALSQSIYELKRLLGDGWLQSKAGRLVVSGDVVVDALEFTRLCKEESFERAVDLYRGPFLNGFFLSNCKGFETWVDRQRAQLERLHRRARRECVNQLVEAKRMSAAIGVARRWVELDAFEDEANHRLIELLALSGDRTEALREYSAYERRLREELAIEPLDHTKQLIEALRTDATARVDSKAPPVIAAASAAPAQAAPNPALDQPGLISELSRRRVLRMAVWYAATAFAVIQFAQTMQEAFHLPPWVLTATAVITIAGFPLAVLVSWHFDWTTEGLRVTHGQRGLAPTTAAAFIAVCVFGGVLWFLGFKRELPDSNAEVALDTSHFAILPFVYHDNVPIRLNEDQLLQDAFSRWRDVHVVDLFQVRDALAREDGELGLAGALRVASELGAGRYVLGEVSRFRDSLRVHAVLYDATRNGKPILDRTVKIALSLANADSAFTDLANTLLFQGDMPPSEADVVQTTRSWTALRAFARGNAAILEWKLTAADSAFQQARSFDPSYSQAELWLAQVRSWSRADPISWKGIAAHVLTTPERLSARDKALAQALLALANNEVSYACALYARLTVRDPRDFVGWYSLADCQSRDAVVLRDESSPSGWRFRSSSHSAVKAYRKAFETLPSIHKAFSQDAYSRVRKQLITSSSALRGGRALAPDTTQFLAAPSWQGDSLALIPYPARDFALGRPWTVPQTVQEAVTHQREMFREVASSWATAFPESPQALEAVAVSLELLGERAAIDTLRRARALATATPYRLELAAAEVIVRVKFAGTDARELIAARVLADSVLRNEDAGKAQPILMASVAALTGRAFLAAQLLRRPDVAATASVGPLLVFSAFGAPIDSIRLLQRAARDELSRTSQAGQLDNGWYTQAAIIAFPVYRFDDFATIHTMNYMLDAEAAFGGRDSVGTLTKLESIRESRRSIPVSELSIDALYTEATMLSQLGRTRQAIEWLVPFMMALRSIPPQQLARPEYTATLVRAMILCADLSQRAADTGSTRRWALAVATLWRNADPFLQSTVARMDRQARGR